MLAFKLSSILNGGFNSGAQCYGLVWIPQPQNHGIQGLLTSEGYRKIEIFIPHFHTLIHLWNTKYLG